MDTDASVEDILARKDWHDERQALRAIMCNTKLEERVRWSKLTYAWDGSNVAIIQAFKDKIALAFLKGALLDDPHGLLKSQGQNTRSLMRMEFTSVGEIEQATSSIRDFIAKATEVEERGLKIERGPADLPDLPEELVIVFENDPKLERAWRDLTPGRQRGYLLHFTEAKKSETRERRIEKCRADILRGRGINER